MRKLSPTRIDNTEVTTTLVITNHGLLICLGVARLKVACWMRGG